MLRVPIPVVPHVSDGGDRQVSTTAHLLRPASVKDSNQFTYGKRSDQISFLKFYQEILQPSPGAGPVLIKTRFNPVSPHAEKST